MSDMFSNFLIGTMTIVALMAGPVMAVGTSDGSSAESPTLSPYAEAKALVDEGSFTAALPALLRLTSAEPGNADAWNLLGFTYRKLGQMEDSDKAYLKVLAINPNHLGALEYQGELFISTGKVDQARGNLAKLKKLCGACEESEDLEKALKAVGA